MTLIHCTLVETPAMPRSFQQHDDEPVSPAGYLSEPGTAPELEPEYCDLLPWADPYIVSLVRALQAATGAVVAPAWPGATASGNGWPNRFGLNGK